MEEEINDPVLLENIELKDQIKDLEEQIYLQEEDLDRARRDYDDLENDKEKLEKELYDFEDAPARSLDTEDLIKELESRGYVIAGMGKGKDIFYGSIDDVVAATLHTRRIILKKDLLKEIIDILN